MPPKCQQWEGGETQTKGNNYLAGPPCHNARGKAGEETHHRRNWLGLLEVRFLDGPRYDARNDMFV